MTLPPRRFCRQTRAILVGCGTKRWRYSLISFRSAGRVPREGVRWCQGFSAY